MNAQQKAQLRQSFKLRVYESNGQAFEDLFVAIMTAANQDFIPVKPHGSRGDRKNDGFDPKRGTYYQVYAPEDITRQPHIAVRKLKDDFAGLREHWEKIRPIRKYFFVVNDKFKGVYPEIVENLSLIERDFNLECCAPLLAANLEQILFALPDDAILSIVGSQVISTNIDKLELPSENTKEVSNIDIGEHVRESRQVLTKYQLKAIIAQIVQETCARSTTEADWYVYAPVLEKYGANKGALIIKRSLIAGARLHA